MTSVQERRMIGPHEAADILELNTKNRPLDQKKVASYAHQMREGRWKDTGVPIIIARELGVAVLDDGQSRLHAIIDSGVTLAFTISVTDERVFDVIDGGKNRSLGDLIAIREESRERLTAKRAATVGIAVDRWMRARSTVGEYNQHTNAERLQLLIDYPRDVTLLVELIRKHRKKFGRQPHAGFLAGALEVYRADPRGDRFFDQLYLEDAATVVRGASSASALGSALNTAYTKDETQRSREQHGQFFDWCRMWNNRVVQAWLRREERGVSRLVTTSKRWLSAGDTGSTELFREEEEA
jgi:ribosomal protein L13E